MSTGIIPTLRTGRAHPHPEPISEATYSAVELMPGDRAVVLLDQRKLPTIEKYEILNRPEQVAQAITDMTIRGAPAIGIAAAYAMVLASTAAEKMPAHEQVSALDAADAALRATRPTAVNLTWALSRMIRILRENAGISGSERTAKLAAEARAIHREDVLACKKIGQLGAAFVPAEATVLTHCNAGALATGGYGTALGVVRGAREAGKKISVIAAETRPLLQGARLTAWELEREGFPVTVVTDSSVASILASGKIDLVVVGADRIAANGDVANKIGTYSVACLAHAHGVPLYVAAPWSTVDLKTKTGGSIPIEQRAEREVTHVEATQIVPDGVRVQNAAFDVTPARLIRAIITERGLAEAPSEQTLARLA